MIAPAVLMFSLMGAALVWLAGRRDRARDPRLTLAVLLLLAGFPVLSLLPKVEVRGLPADPAFLARWLPWIWATGAFLLSLRLVLALARLIRWRQASLPVTDPDYAGHRPEIRMLDGITGPIATGLFRPLILVPTDWKGWPDSMRKTVVAHETAHHRRRDPLWRAVAAITCTLHWFNPLVWWMSSRLADQCEFACDERVVGDGFPPDEYARNLCDAANLCRAPATALAMAHRAGLESRIRRMLAHPEALPKRGLLLGSISAFTCAAGLAMIERAPSDWIPAIPFDEIQTRLGADPFPGDSGEGFPPPRTVHD